MTLTEQLLAEFDRDFPCRDPHCDDNGTTYSTSTNESGEPQPEQCEYCYRERLPYKENLRKALRRMGEAERQCGRDEAVVYILENVDIGGLKLNAHDVIAKARTAQLAIKDAISKELE